MSTVAIVGRKNVGKSTIFNRLIGKRYSIVHYEPGITRDRVYGETHWRGHTFDIIDTGGFFPDEEIALATKIMQQIEFALKESDLIYLVVDAKAGLLPNDLEITKNLRRLNKEIFLVVNKVDNKKDETRISEFYRLGLPKIFFVSAEAGIGFGELLDETINVLPELKPVKEGKEIRILILGRPNAGKSTLLNSILKEERAIVDEKPGTTRDLLNARFIYQGKDMEVIDTAGIRRQSRIKKQFEFYSMMRAIRVISDVDVVILIFDVSEGVVAEDRRIVSLILSKAKGFVIAPNKIDLLDKKKIHRAIMSTRESFEFADFIPIVPISAKYNTGIEELLNTVLDVYLESNKTIDKNVLAGIVDNLRQPPNGVVVKLHQINKNPPVFTTTVTAQLKENYIRYMRSMIRNYFGFKGVPILIKTKIIRSYKKR